MGHRSPSLLANREIPPGFHDLRASSVGCGDGPPRPPYVMRATGSTRARSDRARLRAYLARRYSPPSASRKRSPDMAQRGPLSGITIVALSRILAGPYCTLLLAELGARVIKVEPPRQGDDARHYGPFKNGKSTYFASVNRGKESIALDLKSPQGRDIFERLLDKADALVENFRPGTMDKLGYGWESLHSRYPRLVYAAASGFGHSGPYSHYPAYDMVVQGLGGIMSITGHPGMPPTRVGTSVGDLAGGLYTAVALNAALLHRERTGEANKVDVALFDCQLALLENAIMRYTTTGEIPGPMR